MVKDQTEQFIEACLIIDRFDNFVIAPESAQVTARQQFGKVFFIGRLA
jgi:hypothetical protein